MISPSETLVRLGLTIGSEIPTWVQGPGGNVSEKLEGKLWVKASGARLDHMGESGSYACVGLDVEKNVTEILKNIGEQSDGVLEKNYSDLLKLASLEGMGLGRASMETGFHLILKRKYVLHFHSIKALLLVHNLKQDHDLLNKLGTSLKITVIPNSRPGLILTKTIQEAPLSDIYLLENHGVILHSDSPEILEEWKRIESKLDNLPVDEALTSMRAPYKAYFPDTAVFRDELLKFLNPTSENQFEVPEASTLIKNLKVAKDYKKLSLLEIWWATVILYKACPALAEIHEDISASVSSLPTESYRRSKE